MSTFDSNVETSCTAVRTLAGRLFQRRAVWLKDDEGRYCMERYPRRVGGNMQKQGLVILVKNKSLVSLYSTFRGCIDT